MKVMLPILQKMELDPVFCVLSASQAVILFELFNLLDFDGNKGLDDIQFCCFLLHATNLSSTQASHVFDILDLDKSGMVEFNEFYALVCILVAMKDGKAKLFLYRHWRTCFELLDEDGSKSVSRQEFTTLGYLFGFSSEAVKLIYDEFDVSGNKELDIEEFRLFVFEAINLQQELDNSKASHFRKFLNKFFA
eukprot:NODE_260_length_12610_cov_0.413076.p7 type:complete len:192 gc:universal NODE_260_length_12610_cov_0.413076:363-938(+)